MPKASSNRIIVVTGATKGLGRAMAEAFIAAGHTVYGCGRSQQAIQALADQYGAAHDFAVVDVGDDNQVAAWAGRLLADHPAPDLLINNAALINQPAPLWQVPAEEFAALMQVNVVGLYHVIRHWAPAMIDAGRGVIVNFSSGWGRSTSPDVAPYCTTKWAVEGLTSALAQELPRGMAAVAYSPGVIDTEMLRTCFGESAGQHETPDVWVRTHAPKLLALTARDNGRSL